MSQQIPWRLALLLGAFALIRPALRITGMVGENGILPSAAGVVGATALITIVWVAAAIQSRTARPVLTLMLAGLTYAVLAAVLAAPLSLLLGGELQGPLVHPLALPTMLITNVVWGAAAGCIAWAINATRSRISPDQQHS